MLNNTFTLPVLAVKDDEVTRDHRRKRLKNIIISRLKETRDVLEMRDVLTRSWKTGGMEFSVEQAERVIKEAELAKTALGEELKTVRQEMEAAARQNNAGFFEKTFEQHMEELRELEIAAAPKEELLADAQAVSGITYQGLGGNFKEKPTIIRNTEYGIRNQQQEKPNIDSVKSSFSPSPLKPRVLGPIDELAGMTLEDFRRLGTPDEAARKIVEKVDLLAADSLLEQKKGMDAWKRSEVYRLYLNIGTESLEKKTSVSEVIERRKKAGTQYLSLEEFNTLADVNKKISFSR